MDNESRKQKFIRLAEKRTSDILYRIKVLGNLSNRSSYDFSDDEVNKIFKAVEEQLRLTKSQFISKRKVKFELR